MFSLPEYHFLHHLICREVRTKCDNECVCVCVCVCVSTRQPRLLATGGCFRAQPTNMNLINPKESFRPKGMHTSGGLFDISCVDCTRFLQIRSVTYGHPLAPGHCQACFPIDSQVNLCLLCSISSQWSFSLYSMKWMRQYGMFADTTVTYKEKHTPGINYPVILALQIK